MSESSTLSTTKFSGAIFGEVSSTTYQPIVPWNIQITQNNDLSGFNILENSTSALNNTTINEKHKDTLSKWLVILIASLAAVCVVGLVALVLIWHFCGKKKSDHSNRREVETSDQQSSCCPCFRKTKPKSDTGPGANNSTVLHSAQLKDHDFNRINFTKQPPLPPIESKFITSQQNAMKNENGNNVTLRQDSTNGQQRTPHKRLAPLFQDHERAMEPQNSFSLHGGQQSFSLRGVPVIPVPQDKRRPLPTPPSLE